jgi:hypothetical protein
MVLKERYASAWRSRAQTTQEAHYYTTTPALHISGVDGAVQCSSLPERHAAPQFPRLI